MRQFLKQALASTIGSLLGLTLFSAVSLTLVTITVGALIQSATNREATKVPEKSILTIDLSRSIVDLNPGKSLQETIAGESTRVTELKSILNAIDAAAKDKRIVAIYLDGSSGKRSNTGFATLKEVRTALERFRTTGKQIIAYNIDMDKRDYYLSSVADRIFINPMGSLDVNGFRSETMFFKNAFNKYGVGVEVVRVGKYKSFGETWSLDKFSPEARQETQQLLNNLWNDFKTSIGTSRKLTPETLQKIADERGVLTAQQSIANKLVDKIAYQDEILAQLKKIGAPDKEEGNDYRKISVKDYAEVADRSPTNSSRKIAVLYAQGNIVSGEGIPGQIGGDSLARQLRELRADKDVKAVVLRVNSPGGSALASDIIQREVRLLQKNKPVVVSMGDVAASGGYWISTYSNKIFAESNTITGSIGVIGINFNFQKLANNNGITWDVIKTSKLADSTTVARPSTPQELAISQQRVNDIYDDFLNKVAESRKLPKQKVAEIAQGRVWSGVDAKKVGLVDAIGGLNDAIAYAAETAKLGKDWELEEYPEVEGWDEKILKQIGGGKDAQLLQNQDPLTAELIKVKNELSVLKSFNDPNHVYVRLPFNFNLD
ncbi:signal peptide peptidase SppA [Chamaesiphon minutus]|uniref:Protease 4 n=1 Tax=Chamaesiphon minutus (strain ATCC 27169 / PCC 6605) TaxID=1173020 RepID=K9UKI1_CHAP6|nr:signal peptide peptidase SppA [Chamaesiphon minutus]AFY95168.1 signal peptide peptidase SppA, 67K type [Chamaesiphon minutus PCC 6605]